MRLHLLLPRVEPDRFSEPIICQTITRGQGRDALPAKLPAGLALLFLRSEAGR